MTSPDNAASPLPEMPKSWRDRCWQLAKTLIDGGRDRVPVLLAESVMDDLTIKQIKAASLPGVRDAIAEGLRREGRKAVDDGAQRPRGARPYKTPGQMEIEEVLSAIRAHQAQGQGHTAAAARLAEEWISAHPASGLSVSDLLAKAEAS